MEKDLLSEARKKYEKNREEKITKRVIGEGDRKHLFIWTKRIIKILYQKGKLREEQIVEELIKTYPFEYDSLPNKEILNSTRSILKSLLKKPALGNLKGMNINMIYGYGLVLKNNGKYWWLESLEEKPKTRMKRILDLFKK